MTSELIAAYFLWEISLNLVWVLSLPPDWLFDECYYSVFAGWPTACVPEIPRFIVLIQWNGDLLFFRYYQQVIIITQSTKK